jgi:hypothetical protein
VTTVSGSVISTIARTTYSLSFIMTFDRYARR